MGLIKHVPPLSLGRHWHISSQTSTVKAQVFASSIQGENSIDLGSGTETLHLKASSSSYHHWADLSSDLDWVFFFFLL